MGTIGSKIETHLRVVEHQTTQEVVVTDEEAPITSNVHSVENPIIPLRPAILNMGFPLVIEPELHPAVPT